MKATNGCLVPKYATKLSALPIHTRLHICICALLRKERGRKIERVKSSWSLNR